jgi:hypothetical protein
LGAIEKPRLLTGAFLFLFYLKDSRWRELTCHVYVAVKMEVRGGWGLTRFGEARTKADPCGTTNKRTEEDEI